MKNKNGEKDENRPDEAVANTTVQIENEMDVVRGLTIEQSSSRHVHRKSFKIFLRQQRHNTTGKKVFIFLKFSSSNMIYQRDQQRKKKSKIKIRINLNQNIEQNVREKNQNNTSREWIHEKQKKEFVLTKKE